MSRDELYLQHILDAIEVVRGYVEVGEEAFRGDVMRQDAILRRLAVIGEAVKLLSPDALAAEPQTPWRRIAGMRDRLIHGYASVDLDIVWRVAQAELPQLEAAIRRLLAREA